MKAENSGAKNESKQNHKQEDQQDEELRRGPWTLEEDTMLIHYVACHGEGRWNLLAKSAGLKRTGKSCRLRWLNYLKPDIKRGNLSPQEQLLILELHSKWGNRWSKIAAHLPGRTDNEIKNYWRTRVQKQARQLNMESNSQGFIDAIRCFYMPRLVQKIEQNSTDHDLTTLNDYCDQESTAAQSQIIMLSSSTKLEEDINNFDSTTITKDINNNNNTSSSNATSTSRVSISSIPEFQDQPSPSDVITNTKGSSVGLLPLHDDHDDDTNHHCVNNCDEYDMDMSAGSEFPYMGCQMEGNDWLGNNVAGDGDGHGIMWDLDELWQFRK